MRRQSRNESERRKRFRVWPEPRIPKWVNGKITNYGPSVKQEFLFLEKIKKKPGLMEDLHKYILGMGYTEQEAKIQVASVIPHEHPVDVFLYDGGARSGKTVAAVARTIQYLLENPGSIAIVGAENMPILKRSALQEWTKRFTIHSEWDHPLVARKPTQQEQRVRLTNGSIAWFIHFNDYKILRGIEADIIHIEEASLLPSEDSMDELLRRLSGSHGPMRQLILTTNPEESHSWIYEKFSLKQFDPTYQGEPMPIAKLCECHLCADCKNKFNKEVLWVDGWCPNCDSEKESNCPGKQQWFRVLRTASFDNANIPQDYVQSTAAGMAEAYHDLFVRGRLIELRQGRVYKNFSRASNITNEDIPLDYSKDLYWSFDWNIAYQCSVLCQIRQTDRGDIIDVVDEIVLPESGPEHVALYFLNKYKEYTGTIYLYGDPAGLNRTLSSSDVSRYQIVYNILTNPRKFANSELPPKNVKIMVKKVLGSTKSSVTGRVDSTNLMLSDYDHKPRVYVSPSCQYLIRSLEDLRWKEKEDRPMLDSSCDKLAQKSANKTAIHLLSHVTDALSYLLYKRYPVVEDQIQKPYMHIPGDRVIEASDEGVTEYSPYSPPESKKKKKKATFLEFIESMSEEAEWDEGQQLRAFFG